MTAVSDGRVIDTWDCSEKTAVMYWMKPQAEG